MDRESFQRYLKDPDAFVGHLKREIEDALSPLVTQLQNARPTPPPVEKVVPAPPVDLGQLFLGDAPPPSPRRIPSTPGLGDRPVPAHTSAPKPVTKPGVMAPELPLVSSHQVMVEPVPVSPTPPPMPIHASGPTEPKQRDSPPATPGAESRPDLTITPEASGLATHDGSASQARLRQREQRLSDMIQKDRGEVL